MLTSEVKTLPVSAVDVKAMQEEQQGRQDVLMSWKKRKNKSGRKQYEYLTIMVTLTWYEENH